MSIEEGHGMTYTELRKKQQNEFETFSREKMFFAFNKKQFDEGLEKLNVSPFQLVNVGAGGFVKISDHAEYEAMNNRHCDELREQIDADKTGDGFIFTMFDAELANHEFSYTEDPADAIFACGLSYDDIENNPALAHGLQKAMQRQMEVSE